MDIAVLGTGTVGRTLAGAFSVLGHAVVLGTRDPEATRARSEAVGELATFADAAAHGALVVNATSGSASHAALTAAGAGNLAGKVLLDVANPLDFSAGFPPTLTVANTDSLAESLQRSFPEARLVKSLNTMTASVMVDPASVPGEHAVFVAGEDAGAKAEVAGLLGELGWPAGRILDLGGLRAARGLEMYLPLWLSIMGAVGSPAFNIAVARQ